MKILPLLLASLLLSACGFSYNPRYYYNNVEIANLTGDTIRDLRVQIGIDGRVIACDEVTDKRLCQQRFGKRPYPQDLVDISWRDTAGQQQSRQINPSIPLTLTPSLALRLVLEINADGSIKAYFRQDDFRFGSLPRNTG